MPLIGDKNYFAIEYERTDYFDAPESRKEGFLAGVFQLWIKNKAIGDYQDIIDLAHSKNEFLLKVNYYPQRYIKNSIFMSKNNIFFMFREGDQFFTRKKDKEYLYFKIKILKKNHYLQIENDPYKTNSGRALLTQIFRLNFVGIRSTMDDADIYILNERTETFEHQRIIFRYHDIPTIHEIILPQGYFDECAQAFIDAITKIQNETQEEREKAWAVQRIVYEWPFEWDPGAREKCLEEQNYLLKKYNLQLPDGAVVS